MPKYQHPRNRQAPGEVVMPTDSATLSASEEIPRAGYVPDTIQALPRRGAWYLPLIVALYLLVLLLGDLTAGTEGQSSNADEIFIVLASPIAVIGAYRLLRDGNAPLLLMLLYLVMYGISSAVMLSVPDPIVPLQSVLTGLVLELKVVLFFGMFAFIGFYGVSDIVREQAFRTSLRIVLAFALFATPFYLHDIFSGGTSIAGIPLRRSSLFGYIPVGLFTHKVATATVSAAGMAAAAALYCSTLRIRYIVAFLVLSLFLMLADSIKELIVIPFGMLIIFRTFLNSQTNMYVKASLVMLCGAGLPLALTLIWALIGSNVQRRSDVYIGETSVRSMLYSSGIDIAQNNFPLGSGGGTFGSQPTRSIKYSPLYYQYGFQYHFGSSPKYPLYIMDTWWPKVSAESGFIGALAYMLAIIIPLLSLARLALRDRRMIAVFGFLTGLMLLSMSLASAIFTGSMGVIFTAMFWLCYLMRSEPEEEAVGA